MVAEINTAGIAPERRIDYWRENIARLLKVEERIEIPVRGEFNAHLKLYQLGHLRFMESAGTPGRTVVSQGAQEDSFSLMVPMGGSLRLMQAQRSTVVNPHTIALYNLGHPHEVVALTDYQRITVNIPARDLRNLFPSCDQITATAIPATEGIAAVFLELVKSLRNRIDTLESEPAIASAVADSFGNLLRATLYALPVDHEALLPSRLEVYHRERIKSYVRANLRSNLSVDGIAAAVGLSPRYVHSLFEDETLSLMKWVWAERMDRCRHDLGLGALRGRTVSEIAYSWGYNDPAHFSRVFRARYGVSPSRYREQALASAVDADSASAGA